MSKTRESWIWKDSHKFDPHLSLLTWPWVRPLTSLCFRYLMSSGGTNAKGRDFSNALQSIRKCFVSPKHKPGPLPERVLSAWWTATRGSVRHQGKTLGSTAFQTDVWVATCGFRISINKRSQDRLSERAVPWRPILLQTQGSEDYGGRRGGPGSLGTPQGGMSALWEW